MLLLFLVCLRWESNDGKVLVVCACRDVQENIEAWKKKKHEFHVVEQEQRLESNVVFGAVPHLSISVYLALSGKHSFWLFFHVRRVWCLLVRASKCFARLFFVLFCSSLCG